MIDLEGFIKLKKMKDSQYDVRIRIRNNFIMLSCPEFDLNHCIGSLDDLSKIQSMFTVFLRMYLQIESLVSTKEVTQEIKKRTMSLKEAASFLEISISSLRRLIDSGQIECEKTKGQHRRPIQESIHKYRKVTTPDSFKRCS